MAKLFIVGTPIGNFEDITLRALETLKNVDVIACEDTRVTQKLLNHFNIKNKKLISYHNFNEYQSAKGIIDLIKNKNQNVALVSDAGMPTISDPGFSLIELAKQEEINFSIIPGVSALTTSMALSSLGPEFTFLGFGKQKKEQLQNQISKLDVGTYVFFVAPHKIEYFLDVIDFLKIDHKIFVGREMTKIHETFYEGKANEIKKELIDNNQLKGEFTLILRILKVKKEKINKYASLSSKKL